MSLKLDDFRKRLLPPNEAENGVAAPAVAAESDSKAQATVVSLAAPTTPSPALLPPSSAGLAPRDSESISAAVRKVFGQVGTLQSRADEFSQATEQIDRLNKLVTRVFGPLRNLYSQLSEVAGSFDSLSSFQSQLAGLSKEFEPMRLLHDQVSQLTGSIHTELGQIVKALDPVSELNERANLLARSLKQISELQTDFADLYATFRNSEHRVKAGDVSNEQSETVALH
ncbi:MAG TPA: hypothetical protein VMT61_07725 [Candidatus Binataceae bacterium]|nr:hypothetical protein [Candidatus Binataceae bacterium]